MNSNRPLTQGFFVPRNSTTLFADQSPYRRLRSLTRGSASRVKQQHAGRTIISANCQPAGGGCAAARTMCAGARTILVRRAPSDVGRASSRLRRAPCALQNDVHSAVIQCRARIRWNENKRPLHDCGGGLVGGAGLRFTVLLFANPIVQWGGFAQHHGFTVEGSALREFRCSMPVTMVNARSCFFNATTNIEIREKQSP